MQNQSEQKLQRRRFLIAAARTGALAIMGGLASILMMKRIRLQNKGRCMDPEGRLDCRQCRDYAACSLPRALEARQISEENHGK